MCRAITTIFFANFPVSISATAIANELRRARLDGGIDLHECPLDDAWYRDTGPTFVLADDGTLGAVDWVFNGWGQQHWARWDADRHAAGVAIAATGAQRIGSPLVNEGGGLHTDGAGTFLVTGTVQLDPFRNPGWTKADVEAELAAPSAHEP